MVNYIYVFKLKLKAQPTTALVNMFVDRGLRSKSWCGYLLAPMFMTFVGITYFV